VYCLLLCSCYATVFVVLYNLQLWHLKTEVLFCVSTTVILYATVLGEILFHAELSIVLLESYTFKLRWWSKLSYLVG